MVTAQLVKAELRTRSEFQNRTVTLGVPYILKFEIVRYGEREYGRTDVRCTANVCGERFLVLRTSGVNFSETVCLI